MGLTATDLREWWANASPRERDAKVAALLGFTLWEWIGPGCSRAGGHLICLSPDDGRQAGASAFWRPMDWQGFDEKRLVREPASRIPPFYSTSWGHAGTLFDGMRESGFHFDLGFYEAGWCATWRPAGGDSSTARGTGWRSTGPEAVALAFCLAKSSTPEAPGVPGRGI